HAQTHAPPPPPPHPPTHTHTTPPNTHTHTPTHTHTAHIHTSQCRDTTHTHTPPPHPHPHTHTHTLLLKSARLSWWHTQTQVDIPVLKTGRYTLMHGQVSTGNLTSYTKHYVKYVKCVKPCPCHVAQ